RPSAVRSRDSTTTIRTKLVVMMTMDGASDSTVIRATSWTTRSDRPAPVPRSTLMADCANDATGHAMQSRVTSADKVAARFNSARVGFTNSDSGWTRFIADPPTSGHACAAASFLTAHL